MTRLDQRALATQSLLNLAVARDVRWPHVVRTTLMPKQTGRVPFHNAAEIALRGYHCNLRAKPVLERVTWSPLAQHEGGLHRDYHAGLIFTGRDFAPGVAINNRFVGSPENGAPGMKSRWQNPISASEPISSSPRASKPTARSAGGASSSACVAPRA